jgi:hypothetical protein
MKPLILMLMFSVCACELFHCFEGSSETKTSISTDTGSQEEFVIVSAWVDPNSTNMSCWISVSDGNTLYTGYVEKYGFGYVTCPAPEMNSRVQGGVGKNQKYFFLLLRHGNQTKKETYTITDMHAAH